MMQSILRVASTYMVIKILSMHIPFSLNTALSAPPSLTLSLPPNSFKFSFFCAFRPAQWPSPLQLGTSLGERDWSKVCGLSERGCHWFREAVQTGWTRLVLDRTPAPAGYALTEITRTSEQPVEEGGQKEEGERKKKIERVTEPEKEREETSAVV